MYKSIEFSISNLMELNGYDVSCRTVAPWEILVVQNRAQLFVLNKYSFSYGRTCSSTVRQPIFRGATVLQLVMTSDEMQKSNN